MNDEAKLVLLYGTLNPERYIRSYFENNSIDVDHIKKALNDFKACCIISSYSINVKFNEYGNPVIQIDIKREGVDHEN